MKKYNFENIIFENLLMQIVIIIKIIIPMQKLGM